MSPRENSVKQLAEFYNVVTGVALALAITKVIDTTANVLPIKWGFGLNFLSFVVTIIPFHHGAVRHLFATYVESGEKKRIIRGALALDFLLLFSQACLFVALALLIQKTQLFTSVLIGLLILDCIWGFLTNLTLSNAQDQGSERIWAFINLFGAAFFVLLSSFGPALVDGWQNMMLLVFVGCFVRTALDYYFCWDFYYP
jgi:hypothetical protein